jgi:transcriptional regulator with XRE-family HTH domain
MISKELLIKNLGEIVVRVRKEKKITQDELARIAGTSPMTVQRVETARGGTRLENLITILQALDLRFVDIFREIEGDPQEVQKHHTAWDDVAAKIEAMTPYEREWLAGVFSKVMEKPQ